MEMTTVSRSSPLPTEGEDLCQIYVTNVPIHSVTLLICLCGLLGNGAVLRLHSLKDRNIGIFELAWADFLLLLFTVLSALLFLVEDASCSPVMPQLYLSFVSQLSLVSCYWALFRLTRIRSIVDVYKLFCCCKIRERLLRLADIVQYWAFFVIFIVSHTVINRCPPHQQEHCRAALMSTHTIILVLCAAPMVIFHTINFIKAKWGSNQQQPERRDIVVFLIVIFILLLSLCNLLQQFGYIIVSSHVFFLLNCIHSSIKPFIYFLAGGLRRPCSLGSLQSTFQRLFDEQEEAAHSNDAPMDTGV